MICNNETILQGKEHGDLMNSNLYYDISLPTNMEEGKKYPVLYAMHGRGSNETDIMSLFKDLKDRMILIGIRGMLDLNGGYEYFTIKGFGNPNTDSFDHAITALTQLIDTIPSKYPVDTSRQFLTGFSQGAILSMSLALTLGNQIKGIAALSGYIPKHVKDNYTLKPVDELSIFIAHGKADPIFPLNIGEENYQFFKKRTEQVQFHTYPIEHRISREEQSDVIEWIKEHSL